MVVFPTIILDNLIFLGLECVCCMEPLQESGVKSCIRRSRWLDPFG